MNQSPSSTELTFYSSARVRRGWWLALWLTRLGARVRIVDKTTRAGDGTSAARWPMQAPYA